MVSYINGNYRVVFFSDGTKIRTTKDDEFIPDFAENCDVKITDKCSQNCPFCYEGCKTDGSHGDILSYKFLETLHPYTELAINGNDLDHPQLLDFLKLMKAKKIFANMTVNQRQFVSNYEKIVDLSNQKLVRGIGVSLQHADPTFIEKIKSVKNTVLHTINGVLTKDDINQLKDNGIKLLILGYKELKRGISFKSDNLKTIEKNSKYLYDNIKDVLNMFEIVSFDNLAIEQLEIKRILSDEEWEKFYMGDDGDFTFYIDMVKGEFAKNSLSQERYEIGNKSIDEMFNIIKNSKHEANN